MIQNDSYNRPLQDTFSNMKYEKREGYIGVLEKSLKIQFSRLCL